MIAAVAVFSDNMVLQRGKCVRIFGTCSEDCGNITVTVPELDVSAEGYADGGKWEAVLPPMKACGKCSVVIECGGGKIIFENVAVGEVWLAGGQSNMEFELQNDKNGKQALEEISAENIRFYYTPKCEMNDGELLRAEQNSGWRLPGKESAKCWSAVGSYFAAELSRRLGVTVGIIGCNWGGTSASAWMDREYLLRDKRLAVYLDEYDAATDGKTDEQMIAEYDEYTAYHEAWQKRLEKCYAEKPDIKWAEVLEICGENRYPGPAGCKNPMRPCGLYETMISRVCPYTLAGFIYYQGESDDHRPEAYYALLSALIENWRADWHDDELPFMLVQLPMYTTEDAEDTKNWAVIRRAQERVYKTVKNTGLAVALDCGEFNNIHPTDKKPVGHRLYLQAMYHVYGDGDAMKAFPPMYRSSVVCGDSVRVSFDFCQGFEVRGESPQGFELAAEDGVFHAAEAETDGTDIVLRSREVSRPRLARYCWTNYSEVTLFGLNGIPVAPFDTSVNR